MLRKNFPIKTKKGERGLSARGGRPDATVTGGQVGAAGACFLLGAGLFATHWPPKEQQTSIGTADSFLCYAAASVPC